MRRFLPKRLGSLALTCPKQPPIRHSPTPDELTALGRDTPDAGIAARPDRLGCVEQLPCDTPNPAQAPETYRRVEAGIRRYTQS